MLQAIRRGERPTADVIRKLGEEHTGEFFRGVVEPLADSFDADDAAAYTDLMRTWLTPLPHVTPKIPKRVDTVYVLSRVTLGADIKITSAIINAMQSRFQSARIVLVSNRKSAELYAADESVEHLEAAYPRTGPVSERIAFAIELKQRLTGEHSIVVDPDSRMTQLGLIAVCEPDRYFHFPSRTINGEQNLTQLTRSWLEKTFGTAGHAYIAPKPVAIEGAGRRAAISFGVGENNSKRIDGEFETEVIRMLGRHCESIWIDRGVGGEEAERVTAAAAASGVSEKIRFWEGSFAGFASIISQCDLYTGYDSAGQHAAAAARVPLFTFFRGACSERFRQRWSPAGSGKIHVIDADSLSPEECLNNFAALLE